MVEAVVAAPLLLFLILATAEVTNAFVDHNTLSKTVRNAARYLAGKAILGTTGNVLLTAQLLTETQNLAVYGNAAGTGSPVVSGLTASGVQVVDLGNNNIQVTASYPYTGLMGGALPAFGFGADINLSVTLQATVTMRAL
jgi:Flp pilus assembly protein TadG